MSSLTLLLTLFASIWPITTLKSMIVALAGPILPDYKNFLDSDLDWISFLLKPDPDYPKLLGNLVIFSSAF